MAAPTEYTLERLMKQASDRTVTIRFPGQTEWLPARPEGFYSIRNRLRCAWLAFSGQADVVKWPDQ